MNLRTAGIITFLTLATTYACAADAAGDLDQLAGEWQITLLVDDGELISDAEIDDGLVQHGRFSIEGQVIRLHPHGEPGPRELPFVIDSKANPKTIDIAGTRKTGGKGIYALSGDTLLVCLSGADGERRPREMASKPGSQATLMVLQRRRPGAKQEANSPAPLKSIESSTLVGTWGHQDKEQVVTLTFNADGSYSETQTWKRGFKRLFQSDIRSSGTWKVEDGVVIGKVTASSDKKLANQVFSIRITSLSDTQLVGSDQNGQTRVEWRAP